MPSLLFKCVGVAWQPTGSRWTSCTRAPRRIARDLVVALTAFLALTSASHAQSDFPNRPITLTMPYAPAARATQSLVSSLDRCKNFWVRKLLSITQPAHRERSAQPRWHAQSLTATRCS